MKRKLQILLLTLAALLLSGCAMRTVEQMYTPPKRSDEYKELQEAIDTAMYGMTYCSPQSGENQQTVQMADLDGDGQDEYLVFAKGASEKPLQVLIFQQDEEGNVRTMDTIGFNGSSFEQVEYVEFDEYPGCELVIGIQVSDQVMRSVAVYSFHNGDAEQILLNAYSKFLTCDLDVDGRKELMVFRPGEAEMDRGMAVLYSTQNGEIRRSVETELSESPDQIRRVLSGNLQGGTPGVFVASATEENEIVTDIFALIDGRLTNISFSTEADTSIRTLRNFYVYAEDIDSDGVIELPSLITMKPITVWQNEEQKYLLRWFAVDPEGWEIDKLVTYHDYIGGWYLQLDGDWANRVSVEQNSGIYTFYVWDESYDMASELFTVYVLSGANRDTDTTTSGRFPLYRAEGVAYGAQLADAAAEYDITEEYLKDRFRLIRQDWQTGLT